MSSGGQTQHTMLRDGRLIATRGAAVELPAAARLTLFHPLNAAVEDTLAWRRWLEEQNYTQPFKQAHREVYLLTDAERRTAAYSNRFAGHILRQHALAALCRERGWSYRLQGGFDGASDPRLPIPGTELVAEFLTASDPNAERSGHSIDLYISSDHVRWLHRGTRVELDQIPPLIFSEVMRDIDLFVSVASIATASVARSTIGSRPGDHGSEHPGTASAEARGHILEGSAPLGSEPRRAPIPRARRP